MLRVTNITKEVFLKAITRNIILLLMGSIKVHLWFWWEILLAYLGSFEDGKIRRSLLCNSWNSSKLLWTSVVPCWPSRSTFTTYVWTTGRNLPLNWKHIYYIYSTECVRSPSWCLSWVCGVTYITLVGAVGFNVAAHKQAANEAVAFHGVDSRRKWQNGSLLRWSKLHLGKVVDEEVEFRGHAAQTGLDQPGKMRKVLTRLNKLQSEL